MNISYLKLTNFLGTHQLNVNISRYFTPLSYLKGSYLTWDSNDTSNATNCTQVVSSIWFSPCKYQKMSGTAFWPTYSTECIAAHKFWHFDKHISSFSSCLLRKCKKGPAVFCLYVKFPRQPLSTCMRAGQVSHSRHAPFSTRLGRR